MKRRTLDRFAEALPLALGALRIDPLRSALAIAAIAAAVGTVVLVDTAVAGLAAAATRGVAQAFGSDSFVVAQVASAGKLDRRELERKLERNPALRRADLRYLDGFSGGRALYAAIAQRAGEVVAGGRKFENAALVGTGAAIAEIRDLGIAQGRFFSPEEERAGAPVAVIGHEIAEALFPGDDALGGTVRVAGRAFRVIGVQVRLGTSGGAALDRNLWLPLPAWERAFGAPASLQISARAGDDWPVELAEDRARATLRARHALAPGEDDDFDLLQPEAARNFVLVLARRISSVAPLLGAAALAAAVVVITNTMLVSVARRTFEIGVRRAVGATRGDITHQVLLESTLVSLAGGAIGSLAVAGLVALAAVITKLDLTVRPLAVGEALAVSFLVGLFAGWYPARRAARVDPIVALRSEL